MMMMMMVMMMTMMMMMMILNHLGEKRCFRFAFFGHCYSHD
jgi:hypothetical protein